MRLHFLTQRADLPEYIHRCGANRELGEYLGPVEQSPQCGRSQSLVGYDDRVAGIHSKFVESVTPRAFHALAPDHRTIGTNHKDVTAVGVAVRAAG